MTMGRQHPYTMPRHERRRFDRQRKSIENPTGKTMNSFMCYRTYRHEQLKKENPAIKATGVSPIVSREWKEMTDEEKKPWVKQAQKLANEKRERFPSYLHSPSRPNTRKTTSRQKGNGYSFSIHDPFQKPGVLSANHQMFASSDRRNKQLKFVQYIPPEENWQNLESHYEPPQAVMQGYETSILFPDSFMDYFIPFAQGEQPSCFMDQYNNISQVMLFSPQDFIFEEL